MEAVLRKQWVRKENIQSERMFECHLGDTVTTKSMRIESGTKIRSRVIVNPQPGLLPNFRHRPELFIEDVSNLQILRSAGPRVQAGRRRERIVVTELPPWCKQVKIRLSRRNRIDEGRRCRLELVHDSWGRW